MNRNPCSKDVSRFLSVLTFASTALDFGTFSQAVVMRQTVLKRLFETGLAVKTATIATKSADADDRKARVLPPAATGFVSVAAT